MALTTTPGPTADSLCTLAYAAAYHASRGNTAWENLDGEVQEQLLRRAYDYLFAEYGQRWPTDYEFGAVNEAGDVPALVQNACAVLGLRAKDGPLDPEVKAQKIESTVGPLTSKFAAAPNGARRKFPDIERMMSPYLLAASSFIIPLRRT